MHVGAEDLTDRFGSVWHMRNSSVRLGRFGSGQFVFQTATILRFGSVWFESARLSSASFRSFIRPQQSYGSFQIPDRIESNRLELNRMLLIAANHKYSQKLSTTIDKCSVLVADCLPIMS